MRMKRLVLTMALLVSASALGATTAAQQLPKSGKYKGTYASHVIGGGQSFELEKDHIFFLGASHGVFLNDVADGFLDKTEVTCALVNDLVGGVSSAIHGYCTVTDKDGDKAFLIWEAKDTAPGTGGGPFKWTGGTGKFSGLQGNNNWHGTEIGKTPSFGGLWEGEWRLP